MAQGERPASQLPEAAAGRPGVVGLVWYSREDYGRVLDLMTDARELPQTYDQWLATSENLERRMKSEGHTVIRATLEPAHFLAWCHDNGLKTDAQARARWASEFARRQNLGQSKS